MELAEYLIRTKLDDVIAYADSVGLNFEVVRASHYPPKTGEHVPVVNVWLKREHTRPVDVNDQRLAESVEQFKRGETKIRPLIQE
jgi:hypothetical protein